MEIYAQSGSVTATVIDASTREGVPGAVVEFAPADPAAQKRYFTTGYKGRVEATVPYGTYKVSVSFLGYETLEKELKLSAAKKSLGTLELAPSSTEIEAVVKEVKSMRTSQKGDTVSYNAGAFKVTADADVEGLLKKMPGITITDGEVEAQGETVKKVFVDGKEFFGEDVTSAIKSLPAQAVDKVEVYDKLSDAAEFSGMDDGEGYKAINIVTKPNMRQGQFGKLYAGYGYQPETEGTTSNHKYNVGGNVNLFHGSSRVSVIGLFNNVNQQNFSFEDILGVSGGSGGRGGVGALMVRPQSGVASVNSFGVNYSDSWGKTGRQDVAGQLFLQPYDDQELLDDRQVVRNSVADRYAAYGRLFEQYERQPPPQCPSRMAYFGEPVTHVAHGTQFPELRSLQHDLWPPVGRERSARGGQFQRRRPHGSQSEPVPLLPHEAGQRRPHADA